jgi:3-(methylthio)propionyl---CoA ligase
MLMADGIALRERDVCLPIVQQFHANGWGFPYAALLAGASLAFAGKAADPETLADVIEHAGVTLATAVPTVWAGLLDAVRSGRVDRAKLKSLDRVPVGGAVVSEKLIDGYAALGIRVMHCWGMTEVSPLGTVNGGPKTALAACPDRHASRTAQGLTLPLCATRIVGDGDSVLPHDGRAAGELQITGPWVARAYFDPDVPSVGQKPESSFTKDASGTTWLRTGDLATIDPEGYIRLVDRAKDLIKSGGEWISSVALECALMDHPGVLEAAVIGRPHPKWDERPVAYIVVAHGGGHIATTEIAAHLAARFPKWQLPDSIIVLPELPKGATGKIDKRMLRSADQQRRQSQGSDA